MITWVVGSGGLLGSAVLQRCEDPFDASPIPWSNPEAAITALTANAERFAATAQEEPWRIVWAAGAATVSSSAEQTATELRVFEGFIDGVAKHRPRGDGFVFVTSSAGGVYAGSANPPFTIETTPMPLSPYGELKLAQERIAAERLQGVCPVIIGRISNLYGPGQNLEKLQGLISRLALAAVTQQPINIFVSLDTIRDYIAVGDAADAILDARPLDDTSATTLLIASGQPTTIGTLIRTMNEIAKRRVPVALGQHESASRQVLDLRLEPSPGVHSSTSLPAGAKAVYLDILERMQQTSDRRAPALT